MAPWFPRRATRPALLAALLVAAACGGDNGGPGGDQPTSIAISDGNAQAVRYATPVTVAPSVVVTNAKGPMPGVTVTFSVTSGGGSVTGATPTTDEHGIATVGGWTLGPAPGVNTLRASAGSISININATAITGPPATIAIVAGNNQTWVQGSIVPTAPSVLVTDGQFPVPAARVVFSVTSGGGSLIGPVQTTGANGVASVAGWRLGPAEGNSLTATVSSTALAPVTFTATAQPLVITGLTKIDGDNQSGFAGNFAARKPTVAVLNQFNQPTEGVPVTFTVQGGGSIAAGPTPTALDGQAELPFWRYGAPGAQSVTATAGAATPVTFSAMATTVPVSDYKINISYPAAPGVPQPSPAVKQVFTDAVTRWQTLIVGGLPPVILAGSDVVGPFSINISGVGSVPCIPQIADQTVKDVNIYVYIRPIDGTSGSNILGLATPVYARDGSLLPYAGCMIFDSANIDQLFTNGTLAAVILHEMAHVFGFGTIWDEKHLLVGGCNTTASPAPSFIGQSSQEAFVAALAGGQYDNPITPVEGDGSCNDGTRDGHWSESVMGDELMTGFINIGANPLSAVTSSSLRDLGYVVNDVPSDPYTVPSPTAALRMGAAGDRMQELDVPVPIIVTDGRGRTTRIIEP